MNNRSFSTTTTISEDYMLFPYNDHYSSQTLLPFSPCSSINDILIHSNSNISSNHLDHHYQFLQAPSSFSQFEFVPDFALLPYFHPQNNGHNDNKTITTNDHHHPPVLPLNNPIGESLVEPRETITAHTDDSQRNSTSQGPKMNKVKKTSRTDRHSKIKTAKGTRDRRMRLSLDVAKELFGLQDMLGFDKASKTVEWLLTQAKPEIIKITSSLSNQFKHGGEESQTRKYTLFSSFKSTKDVSTCSDPFDLLHAYSELVTFGFNQVPAIGSMHTSSDLCKLGSMWTVEDRGSKTNSTETRENKVGGRLMRGKRKMLQPRTPILKKLSKDARARARERAKDRTKEKMMKRISQVNILDKEAHSHHDEIVENNKNHVNCKSFEVTPCEEEMEELCKNDGFAVCKEFVVNKFDSSFLIPYHHRSQETASSADQQQHQFMDFHHYLERPRDLMYNNHNMS